MNRYARVRKVRQLSRWLFSFGTFRSPELGRLSDSVSATFSPPLSEINSSRGLKIHGDLSNFENEELRIQFQVQFSKRYQRDQSHMEAAASAPPWIPEDDLRLKKAMEVLLCKFSLNFSISHFSPFTFKLLSLLPLKYHHLLFRIWPFHIRVIS